MKKAWLSSGPFVPLTLLSHNALACFMWKLLSQNLSPSKFVTYSLLRESLFFHSFILDDRSIVCQVYVCIFSGGKKIPFSLWESLWQCGIMWTVLTSRGIVWTVLTSRGIVWTVLTSRGIVWTVLTSRGIVWTVLTSRGIVWTVLTSSGITLISRGLGTTCPLLGQGAFGLWRLSLLLMASADSFVRLAAGLCGVSASLCVFFLSPSFRLPASLTYASVLSAPYFCNRAIRKSLLPQVPLSPKQQKHVQQQHTNQTKTKQTSKTKQRRKTSKKQPTKANVKQKIPPPQKKKKKKK